MGREPGDTDVRTIVELDDGTQIQYVKEWVEKESSRGDHTYIGSEEKIAIVSPEGNIIETKSGYGHSSSSTRSVKWREKVIEPLVERVNEFTVTEDQNAVPVNIISEGKPAVTAYLYAIHGWSYNEIQEALGLTQGTIHQYMIDIANDNR